MYAIHCGDGSQKIKWLAEVACHRYDPDYLFELGPVADVRLQEGKQLNMDDVIESTLADSVHLYVQLTEDLHAIEKLSGEKKAKRK